MPSKYVRRTKMAARGKTYRKSYSKKGVTAKLVKTIIHSEAEKKYREVISADTYSANTYTYTLNNVLYNAPLLLNFWNVITAIDVGSGFNQREGSKIFITKLCWKINIRAYDFFKTPYNNIALSNNTYKPCVRIIKSFQRKIPNGPVKVAEVPYWNREV